MITDSEVEQAIKYSFDNLLNEKGFDFLKVNSYVYEMKNESIVITLMIERDRKSFAAFLKEDNGKNFPFWELYKELGSPPITVDFTKDKLTRNLIWHANFVALWLSENQV